ncbi:MAG: gamma-glutamyl-gamma-aminobutyrate hydrolase family protein [Acidimicrobiia bacterium]
MVTEARVPLVAMTGRRLGKRDRWPYTGAAALPRGYLDAVRRAGGLPLVAVPNGDLRPVLDRVDALVLTGGPDLDPDMYGEAPHPTVYGVDRSVDEAEIAVARDAIDREIPVLAICRGMQVLNVALGGTLHQHIADRPGIEGHGRPGEADGGDQQEIAVEPGSLLAGVFGATRVIGSCHHHQAVAKLGDGLQVTATARDGIIEGLGLGGRWLLAVQWHPEDTADTDLMQQRLFDALVERARD